MNDLCVGYCDVFLKCRAVDADGPLVRLKNLLLNKETLQTLKQYIIENWYFCVLLSIIFLIFMGFFIKCCAVHTPSSNPKKAPARRISETLRHPMNTLRRIVRTWIAIWNYDNNHSLFSDILHKLATFHHPGMVITREEIEVVVVELQDLVALWLVEILLLLLDVLVNTAGIITVVECEVNDYAKFNTNHLCLSLYPCPYVFINQSLWVSHVKHAY